MFACAAWLTPTNSLASVAGALIWFVYQLCHSADFRRMSHIRWGWAGAEMTISTYRFRFCFEAEHFCWYMDIYVNIVVYRTTNDAKRQPFYVLIPPSSNIEVFTKVYISGTSFLMHFFSLTTTWMQTILSRGPICAKYRHQPTHKLGIAEYWPSITRRIV